MALDLSLLPDQPKGIKLDLSKLPDQPRIDLTKLPDKPTEESFFQKARGEVDKLLPKPVDSISMLKEATTSIDTDPAYKDIPDFGKKIIKDLMIYGVGFGETIRSLTDVEKPVLERIKKLPQGAWSIIKGFGIGLNQIAEGYYAPKKKLARLKEHPLLEVGGDLVTAYFTGAVAQGGVNAFKVRQLNNVVKKHATRMTPIINKTGLNGKDIGTRIGAKYVQAWVKSKGGLSKVKFSDIKVVDRLMANDLKPVYFERIASVSPDTIRVGTFMKPTVSAVKPTVEAGLPPTPDLTGVVAPAIAPKVPAVKPAVPAVKPEIPLVKPPVVEKVVKKTWLMTKEEYVAFKEPLREKFVSVRSKEQFAKMTGRRYDKEIEIALSKEEKIPEKILKEVFKERPELVKKYPAMVEDKWIPKTEKQIIQEKVLKTNKSFIISLAKRKSKPWVSAEELEASGLEAFSNLKIEHLPKEVNGKMQRLSPYARTVIHNAMKKTSANLRSDIITAKDPSITIAKIGVWSNEFYVENGRIPTYNEIASKFEVKVKDIESLARIAQRKKLEPIEGKDLEYEKALAVKDEAQQVRKEMEGYLDTLPNRDRDIYKFVLGWDTGSPMTYEEAGRVFKISADEVGKSIEKSVKNLQIEAGVKIKEKPLKKETTEEVVKESGLPTESQKKVEVEVHNALDMVVKGYKNLGKAVLPQLFTFENIRLTDPEWYSELKPFVEQMFGATSIGKQTVSDIFSMKGRRVVMTYAEQFASFVVAETNAPLSKEVANKLGIEDYKLRKVNHIGRKLRKYFDIAERKGIETGIFQRGLMDNLKTLTQGYIDQLQAEIDAGGKEVYISNRENRRERMKQVLQALDEKKMIPYSPIVKAIFEKNLAEMYDVNTPIKKVKKLADKMTGRFDIRTAERERIKKMAKHLNLHYAKTGKPRIQDPDKPLLYLTDYLESGIISIEDFGVETVYNYFSGFNRKLNFRNLLKAMLDRNWIKPKKDLTNAEEITWRKVDEIWNNFRIPELKGKYVHPIAYDTFSELQRTFYYHPRKGLPEKILATLATVYKRGMFSTPYLIGYYDFQQAFQQFVVSPQYFYYLAKSIPIIMSKGISGFGTDKFVWRKAQQHNVFQRPGWIPASNFKYFFTKLTKEDSGTIKKILADASRTMGINFIPEDIADYLSYMGYVISQATFELFDPMFRYAAFYSRLRQIASANKTTIEKLPEKLISGAALQTAEYAGAYSSFAPPAARVLHIVANVFELMFLQPKMGIQTLLEPFSEGSKKKFREDYKNAPKAEKRRVVARYGLMILALSGLGTHLMMKLLFGKKTKTVAWGYKYAVPLDNGMHYEITALSPFNYQFRLYHQIARPIAKKETLGTIAFNLAKWRQNPMWGVVYRILWAGKKEGGVPVSTSRMGTPKWAKDAILYAAVQTHVYYKKMYPRLATGISREELNERKKETIDMIGKTLYIVGQLAGYSSVKDYTLQKNLFLLTTEREMTKDVYSRRLTSEERRELIKTYFDIADSIKKHYEKKGL